jgi:predicted nucleic acid-binding Zn ribbon protein
VSSEQRAANHRLCPLCHTFLQYDATVCDSCKATQYKRQCVSCGYFIPFGAVQCKECKSYQGWRRHFGFSTTVLALLVALISVLTPLLRAAIEFATHDSETSIAFQGETIDEIRISAMNTGRSPSLLRSYQLVSGDHGVLQDARLELVAKSPEAPANVVPPNAGITVRLRVDGMTTSLSPAELRQKLGELVMTVQTEVEESDGGKHTVSDSFPALRIEQVILKFTTRENKKVQR